MRTNVTAEHRVQLSEAAGYLGRCVHHAEPVDDERSKGALVMLSYVLGMPMHHLARLSSQAKEAAGVPTPDSYSEITLWLDRYTDHLANALSVALTPGG